MEVVVDGSFKKPGAIPFKWEIRPGVPKLQLESQEHASSGAGQQQQQKQSLEDEEFSFPETPRKLAPPPAGYCFQPPITESRSCSFRSAPRSRSGSFRFYTSNLVKPVSTVSSSGCFPSPLLIRKSEKYKTKNKKPKYKADPEQEMDSPSDLETLSRWSVSSGKSLSPFRDSPLSSSFSSSHHLTPPRRLVNDAEWAGFGLF